MSRIGRKPVQVPSGVDVAMEGQQLKVKGPLGELHQDLRPEIGAEYDKDQRLIQVTRKNDDRVSRALHGLSRALIQNMVIGVTQGYEKRLQIVGVGYIAAIQGQELQLRVGYANEVVKSIPKGLDVQCPDQTHIVVKGCDKQLVGQFAAEVRAVRKPEPYKGKGVRYQDEFVKIKPGKAAT